MTITSAIILSAGKGSRLLPLTADRPKCLIDFAGRNLLEWQIDSLKANGIERVTIVTGFRSDLVDAVAAARPGVETLFNPFYHVADNLGSVWMVRHAFDRDTLLLNGDTLVSPDLVATVLAGANAPINVTIDVKPDYDADDMKVWRDAAGLLRRIGKTLTPEETNAESIGLLAFRGEGRALFTDAVERAMHTPAGTASWYLKVIDTLAPTDRVGTVPIVGHEWAEVDFPADLEKATALTERWRARGL
ncbi:phosphocholine cytidylyltransferase family protein [Sphingomonas naphthae]|uniref:Phosphocholine cytidylyltransferase family protein n=1 Tax=Sphingomonas naphthae TaxID=1813468 RepID=A0ABY7THX7_9SPHN|nr:phosphocholine cytidylyltransferase family protein [Sphingomonas naphthae]WCT72785.1 phosphocholine cytidylyltransferase family protein [Sphingomonas naphthae]